MSQTLEAIKGCGGSVKVGSTGTISSLITRELEHIKSVPEMPSPRARALPVSAPVGATTPKRTQQPRRPSDEASSSTRNSNGLNHRNSEIGRKTNGHARKTHRAPMLGSDSSTFDTTPSRGKTDKKGTNIVEIVDIKCGNPDKAWASPITTRLKKLGFSKLSESII